MLPSFWSNKRVCVLGGAGFIGSHLADALVPLAKEVAIADDLSSGLIENLPAHAWIFPVDLRDFKSCLRAIRGCDVVFHLASDVGGRGYMRNKTRMWGNLELDATVFRACAGEVPKVVYFSSACVYPTDKFGCFHETEVCLVEKADGAYGMEKLVAERMLKDFPFRNLIIRPFTVYGPRMKENRAIGALIAKYFIHQDPFEVWGNGTEEVDWIYVDDVVKGTILAAEKMEGVVNIGSGRDSTPLSAMQIIERCAGWVPDEIDFKTDMPTTPLRIADTTRLQSLGWKPEFSLERGIQETVDWYFNTRDIDDVRASLERRLVER